MEVPTLHCGYATCMV